MNTIHVNQADAAVMPLRFTDHLPQMRDFLAVLGFSPRVSRDESWADLAGVSGFVALHAAAASGSGARSGHTSLSFEVPDVAALAARLRPAFADLDIYDEAWGRVLLVRGGDGRQFDFNERFTDDYGYRVDEPRPAHGVVAAVVCHEPPSSPLPALLAAAGFRRTDDGGQQWEAPAGGLIAIAAPTDRDPSGTTALAARTREPLDDLAERPRGAGHADARRTAGGALAVTDPDGQTILAHAAATTQT